MALHDSGATVAAVNLGSTAGAFDANPAFDFTTAALDAQKLVEAVALVYQRFLGAKQVQTGEVVDRIEVEIAPYVEEAFLVVAADGPVSGVEIDPGHPAATAIDANHRGGGETRGLEGRVRGYRIVRLERPGAGRWTFRVPGLQDRAGWMLLQDSALEVRLVSTPTLARGAQTPVEAEVVDRATGRRITDPALLAKLEVSVDVEGRRVRLTDDGQGADRAAGDGVLTGTVTFEEAGRRRLALHLGSDLLDRTRSLEVEVVPAKWDVRVTTPARAEIGVPVRIAVALEAVGDAASLSPPNGFDVLTGSGSMTLGDDGESGDEAAGDRIYSALWTPADMGTMHLEYVPRGGVGASPAGAALEVVGGIRFGPPVPLELGETGGKSELYGDLDLSPAAVRGRMEVRISSDFEATRSALEIDLGRGWTTLGDEPLAAELTADGPDAFPVRLRVGRCPQACRRDAGFTVRVAATTADDSERELVVPLALAIVPDAWWVCWWPVLAAIAGLIVAAFAVWGFVSPSRFAPRLGVVLSPEEDLEEGFFHPIRGQRGTGAGFYRDAHVFVTADHRLSSRPAGAIARLRAHGQQVRIQPLGATLWRRNADGEWERLSPDETSARYGVPYCNDLRTLYFAIRNA
jgi:hypothetical protein